MYLTHLKHYQDGIDELAEKEQWQKETAREKRAARKRGEEWVPPQRARVWRRTKKNVILPQRENYHAQFDDWEADHGFKELLEQWGYKCEPLDEEKQRLKIAAYPRYKTPPLPEEEEDEEEEDEVEEE